MSKSVFRVPQKKAPPPPPPVKADHLGNMIRDHMRARKITYEFLAQMVGGTKSGVSAKKCRGMDKFQVGELFAWCRALNVSPEALETAIGAAYRQTVKEGEGF